MADSKENDTEKTNEDKELDELLDSEFFFFNILNHIVM